MRYEDEPSELEEALIEAANRIERSILWDVKSVFEELLMDEVDCLLIPNDEDLSWKSFYEIAKNACEQQNWPKAGISLVNMLESRMLLEQQHKAFMEDNELKLFYIFQNRSLDKVKFFISNNYQIKVIKCNVWALLHTMAHKEINELDNPLTFSPLIDFLAKQMQYEKDIQRIIHEDEIPLYYFFENCSLKSAKKFFEEKYSLIFPSSDKLSWANLLKYVDSKYIEGFLENDVLMQVVKRRLDDESMQNLDKATIRNIKILRKDIAKTCLALTAKKPKLQLKTITSWNMLLNFVRDFQPRLKKLPAVLVYIEI